MTRTGRRSAWVAVLLLAVGLAGCVGFQPPCGLGTDAAAIACAYQHGVRDALAGLSAEARHDSRVTWAAPVVQQVWVPPQVMNGVFIPGHREWVVIHPPAWQREVRREVDESVATPRREPRP